MNFDINFAQHSDSSQIPTVGRELWYWPVFGLDDDLTMLTGDQPFQAKVLYVYTSLGNTVNLQVIDHVGNTKTRFQVPVFDLPELDADGQTFETRDDAVSYLMDTLDDSRGIATWMPYQTKQHNKQTFEDASTAVMQGETVESLMPDSSSVPVTGYATAILGEAAPQEAAPATLVLTDGRDV